MAANPQDVVELRERIGKRMGRNLTLFDASELAKPALELTHLRQWLASLKEACRRVGQMPPTPPTLRGRVGRCVVAVIQRALFWLIPPVRSALFDSARLLEEYLAHAEGMLQLTHRMERETGERLAGLQDDFQVRLTNRISRLDSIFAARLSSETSRLDQELTQRFTQEYRRIAEEFESVLARLEQRVREGLDEIKNVAGKLQWETALQCWEFRRELAEQSRRVSLLLREVRNGASEPLERERPRGLSEEYLRRLDGVYLAFEDLFRGSRADVQGKVEVYLPWLKAAHAGEEGRGILDVGCGRGEWLELLQERHLRARGVDWNRAMVAECQSRGLEVEERDLLECLRALPANSLGAVTGFHIVEHLAFDKLMEMLEDVARVLKRGGVAIFETPNPENLLVGACQFYLDPTHRNPIPAPTLRFLVEAAGLSDVEVAYLHPCPGFDGGQGRPEALGAELNRYFYGAQDYAVIARKV